MSLSVDDFFEKFSEAELREITLTTMDGSTVFLRALPYSKVWNFRVLASKIARARIMQIAEGDDKEKQEDWNQQKARAEDYLIQEAMANHDGSKFFSDTAQFNKWRDQVPNSVVNEILFHIDSMNELDDGFDPEKYEADQKIKKK
jgi:hypothetical protein